MKKLIVLLVAGLVLVACSDSAREERTRERAERDMERAQEDLARAREKVADARDRLREAGGRLSEDARRTAADLEGLDVAALVGGIMQDVGEALQTESGIQPVDFRKLRDLLPDEVDSMPRQDVEGETAGAFGIRVSSAKGRYSDADGREVEVSIVDLGTLRNAAEHGARWMDAQIDRESSDGWERTTSIDGHPAYLKSAEWDGLNSSEATVFVAERFVVNVRAQGRDLRESIVTDILDEIDLDRLAGLVD